MDFYFYKVFNLILQSAISNFLLSSLLIGFLAINKNINSNIQLIIFCIFAIVLSSGLVLDYPYPTELFDIKVRGTGVGTCITISRFGAAAGTFLLPILTNLGGAHLAMITCAVVLFAAFVICLIWAPETSPQFKQNN